MTVSQRAKTRRINCPCAKQGNCKLIPQTSNDWPCDLFMVIAKAKSTGNCRCLKSNDKSVGIIGVRGIKTSSPLYLPLMIIATRTLFIKFFTASRGCYVAWLLLIVNVRWESRKIHWIQKLCGIVDYVILVYNCVNWFEWKQLSRKKVLIGRIEIIYIFIFCRKYCLFTQTIMVIELLCYVCKNTLKSSSLESVKWQKSEDNVMNPIEVSMAALPFPVSKNCFI